MTKTMKDVGVFFPLFFLPWCRLVQQDLTKMQQALAKLSLALAVAGLMAIMTAFSGSKAADSERTELIGLFDAYRPGLLAFSNPCYEIVQGPGSGIMYQNH